MMNLSHNFFQSYAAINSPRAKTCTLTGHTIVHLVTLPRVTFVSRFHSVIFCTGHRYNVKSKLSNLESKNTSFIDI